MYPGGMPMARIQLNDTMMDAALKVCEGNPGAATVCAQMLKDGEGIDPDSPEVAPPKR